MTTTTTTKRSRDYIGLLLYAAICVECFMLGYIWNWTPGQGDWLDTLTPVPVQVHRKPEPAIKFRLEKNGPTPGLYIYGPKYNDPKVAFFRWNKDTYVAGYWRSRLDYACDYAFGVCFENPHIGIQWKRKLTKYHLKDLKDYLRRSICPLPLETPQPLKKGNLAPAPLVP